MSCLSFCWMGLGLFVWIWWCWFLLLCHLWVLVLDVQIHLWQIWSMILCILGDVGADGSSVMCLFLCCVWAGLVGHWICCDIIACCRKNIEINVYPNNMSWFAVLLVIKQYPIVFINLFQVVIKVKNNQHAWSTIHNLTICHTHLWSYNSSLVVIKGEFVLHQD